MPVSVKGGGPEERLPSRLVASAGTLAVVGSRNYPDLDRVRTMVGLLRADATVISGGGSGVDRVAQEAADDRGLLVIEIRPFGGRDQHRFARAAVVRDAWFGRLADVVVAFWDGESRGTQHAIRGALSMGKCVVALPGSPPEVWVPRIAG